MMLAIGTAPRPATQPTVALESTPKADWVAPRSDDAPPARSPKGDMAITVALEAIRPIEPMMKSMGMKTPQKPTSSVSERTKSTLAEPASSQTPRPSVRRVPSRITTRRLSCDTLI